jgi:hypothetical protein
MSTNPFYSPALMAAAKAYHHQSLQLNTPANRGMLPGQATANYNKQNAWNPHDPYMRGMATYYNAVANDALRRPSPPRKQESPTRKQSPRKQSPTRKQSPRKQSPTRKQSPPRTPKSPSKKGGRVSHRRIRRTRRHH